MLACGGGLPRLHAGQRAAQGDPSGQGEAGLGGKMLRRAEELGRFCPAGPLAVHGGRGQKARLCRLVFLELGSRLWQDRFPST